MKKRVKVQCKPDFLVYRRARNISSETCKIDQFNEGIVMYTKVENNDNNMVDFLSDTCTCKYFLKPAYCKHILNAYEKKIGIVGKLSLITGSSIKVIPRGQLRKWACEMCHYTCFATQLN